MDETKETNNTGLFDFSNGEYDMNAGGDTTFRHRKAHKEIKVIFNCYCFVKAQRLLHCFTTSAVYHWI